MPIFSYQADLHIHTLLSPCAELEMIPSLIIEAARMAGLDMIGIADHNSCENAGAVMRASGESGVKVLPGMEVQTLEGVHLLCLFDSLINAERLQEAVYKKLPTLAGAGKYYEHQIAVDWRDEFVGYCEKLISMPTSLDIDEVWELVESLDGIVIPSHIDRQSTGMCGVLGMMPESPAFDAVEISANITAGEARTKYPSIGNRPILQNSDAHWLSAIGEHRTTLYLEHRRVSEIKMACRNEGGRRIGNA